MKAFVTAVLALLLAGCATERYYPVYLPEGGGYYVAERDYVAADPGARYDSLFAVGVYPWWVHTFYTPYFYPWYFTYYHPYYYPYYGPYHLAGWYPAWAYDPGYGSHYASGWPPYWPRHSVPPGAGQSPGQSAGSPPPGEAGHGQPGSPIDQPVGSEPGRSAFGERAFAREPLYRGAAPQRPAGVSPAPQRVTAPVNATVRARALAPGSSTPASPDVFASGGSLKLPPASAYSGRIPAAPIGQPRAPLGQPTAPAVPGQPLSGEPARIPLPPSERSPAERDQ